MMGNLEFIHILYNKKLASLKQKLLAQDDIDLSRQQYSLLKKIKHVRILLIIVNNIRDDFTNAELKMNESLTMVNAVKRKADTCIVVLNKKKPKLNHENACLDSQINVFT